MRWGLLLAYLSATAFAHGTHNHARRGDRAANHAEPGGDVLVRSSTDRSETATGTHHDGCAACRFLAENQATGAIQIEHLSRLAGEVSSTIHLARYRDSTWRFTSRAPPAA